MVPFSGCLVCDCSLPLFWLILRAIWGECFGKGTMAVKSRSVIIGEIESYVGRNGNNFAEWFVGSTGEPKATLFSRHKVKQVGGAWIARLAKDDLDAHDVVEYFLTTRGVKGKSKQRTDDDVYVYAFKVTSDTKI